MDISLGSIEGSDASNTGSIAALAAQVVASALAFVDKNRKTRKTILRAQNVVFLYREFLTERIKRIDSDKRRSLIPNSSVVDLT